VLEPQRQPIAQKLSVEEKKVMEAECPQYLDIKTDEELLAAQALDYEMTNQRVKLLQARMSKVLRPAVERAVSRLGTIDFRGHKHLKLPNGVEVIHERRAPIVFNTTAAETLLENKGLLEVCSHVEVVTTRVLDEEKIVEAYEAGLLSPQEYDSLFTEAVSWAMKIKVDETINPEYELLTKIRKDLEKKPAEEMPIIE
jgi:hypothetical protein